MRMIRGLMLSLMLLLPVAASALDAFPESDNEPDTMLVIPGANRLVVTMACDRVLTMQLSVFSGPPDIEGRVLIYTIPEGMDARDTKRMFSKVFSNILQAFIPKIAIIKLEETGAWQCA